MLNTEIEVNKYYFENIRFWDSIRNIYLREIPKVISEYILSTLKKNISFEINDLENIWRNVPIEFIQQNLSGGINNLTKILYERDKSFDEIYGVLCKEIQTHFNEDMVFQRVPTIRIHSSSKDDKFYPQWHSDLILGHPVGTINIWIPFTNLNKKEMHGFNICEPEITSDFYKKVSNFYTPYQLLDDVKITKSTELMKKSKSLKTEIGEATVFDSRCFHSAIPIYEHTRVSMDLRIIEKRFLESPFPQFIGRGRKKAKFDVNNFYMKLKF